MSLADTPTTGKKRDLSSPISDVENPVKKSKPIATDSDTESDIDTDSEFEMANSGVNTTTHMETEVKAAEASVVQMNLQDSDLIRLSGMLKEVMICEVKDLVRDVITGVTEAIHGEVKQLKSDCDDLRKENEDLRARVAQLEKGADDIEQYTRRNSVRVTGIPEQPGESTDALVLGLSKDLKAGITRFDIDRSHRVGKPEPNKTRAIIVKFSTYNARRRFMANRRALKTRKKEPNEPPVFVNEDLTSQRNKLLYLARQQVKGNKLESAWSMDGKIFVKYLNGHKGVVSCESDLVGLSHIASDST